MDKEFKTCSRCNKTKDVDLFIKKRNICKSCISIYNKVWAVNNRKNTRANYKKWRDANLERERGRVNNYYVVYPEKRSAKEAKRRSSKLQATPEWTNEFFIKEIYHLAKIRTETTGIKWHVDHIVPLRSKIVCGLHCEANLRVITSSENISKGNRHWPDMPEDN